MSNQHNKEKKSVHDHIWKKQERTLGDNFNYFYYQCDLCYQVKYPGEQLQKIFDYKKHHLFLTVRDTALLLLYIGEKYNEYQKNPEKNYIPGITFYQKLLFLFYNEIAPDYEIPTENPGFYGYKYGPYSDTLDLSIGVMVDTGLLCTKGVKSSNNERIYLTEKGKKVGEEIYKKLSKVQIDALLKFRLYWDEKKLVGLKKYVYGKYESYTKHSLILEELFPGRKLYRRRG